MKKIKQFLRNIFAPRVENHYYSNIPKAKKEQFDKVFGKMNEAFEKMNETFREMDKFFK